MSDLTPLESELVALGAALGSNCVPCIEYHIPQARKAGLSDGQIHAAIQRADMVRQVPAGKVLDSAMNLLSKAAGGPPSTAVAGEGCGCASAGKAAEASGTANADRTIESMAAMMSRMMASCGSAASSAGAQKNASGKDQEIRPPQTGTGCC